MILDAATPLPALPPLKGLLYLALIMFKPFTLVGACLTLFALPFASQDSAERPNVVLIGLRELSAPLLAEANNLQGLLASGALIPKAEVVVPRGLSELALLMTGLMPRESKVRLNVNHPSLGDATTLADLLRSEGYATFGAGFSPAPWEDLAFDASHDEVNPLALDGRSNLLGRIDELDQTQPFFLWWCPEPIARGGALDSQSIQAIDGYLGHLITGLKRSQRHDNTLYVLVNTGAPNDNPERRRSRGSIRETPIVFSHAGLVQKGKRHEVLATTADVFPTLLDYLGIDSQDLALSGSSLRPLLQAGAPFERERVHAALYSTPETTAHPRSLRDEDLRSLTQLYSRDRRWKYVLYLMDVRLIVDSARLGFLFSAGDQELYDLEADPDEHLNLAGVPGNAQLVSELRQGVLDWWASTGATSPPLKEFIVPLEPKKRGDRAADKRPNIVLLIADDLDGEHYAFMGNDKVQMPVLDSLAEGGTVFTRAHVTSSRSRASLASLLSGLYPHQSRITANQSLAELRTRNSLPNLLKEAGYATFMGGRFLEENRYAMGFTDPQWEEVARFARVDQESMLEFLDSQGDKRPFFIWWAPTIPSEPFNAPKRHLDLFKDTQIEAPAGFQGNLEDYKRHELEVMAMEAWLDENLGQLTSKLKQMNQLDNTLFCYLSDNGSSNFRPSRGSTFEKGLHTPIIFNYKGKIKAGQHIDELLSSVDIFPTLLDYAEVTAPANLPGHSLRSVLEGSGLSEDQRSDYLFGAGYRASRPTGRPQPESDIYSIYARDSEWKYVLYIRNVTAENTAILVPVGSFPSRNRGDEELYKLSSDPYEFENLAWSFEHKERIAKMRAAAIDWWLSTGGKETPLLKR